MTLNELVISWLPGDSITGKINTFFKYFHTENQWVIKRHGQRVAMEDYLSGLPSWIDIPFHNHEIIELAKKNELFPAYSDDEILEKWFSNIAQSLFKFQGFVNAKPTVALIANNSTGFYFSRKTLEFWKQRRSDFRVYKTDDPDVYKTYAIYRIPETDSTGESIAYWRKTANCKFEKDQLK